MQILKFLAGFAALLAVIPLFIWGATGSWRHGLWALRQYLRAMAWVCVPVLLVVAISGFTG